MRPNDPRAGFTFVEVLAALVITAAFAAVVLPFAGRLASRWWLGETKVEAADAWMQAIARLSDDLAQAVPIARQQADSVTVEFAAGPDFIQFVRPALTGSSRIRLETVRFDIRRTDGGQALVRRAGWFRPGSALELGPPTTLVDGPFQLRLRAFGEDNVPRAAWENDPEMPVGVELRAFSPTPGTAPPVPVLLRIVAKAVTKKTVSVYATSQP